MVIDNLKEELIQKLREKDPRKYPYSLFEGLEELVNQEEQQELLRPMLDFAFPPWIRLIVDHIMINSKKPRQKGSPPPDNDKHFDSVIKLLAASVTDEEGDENVEKIKNNPDLMENIAKIIKHSNWQHNRYIPCLNLIAKLANSESECAD